MPTLKIKPGKSSKAALRYVLKQNPEGTRVVAVGGNVLGRTPEAIEKEFAEVRAHFGKHYGRQYSSVYISFERHDLGDLAGPKGVPDPGRLIAYGEEWAGRAGIAERYDYVVVHHGDKPHPHIHVVWNATDFLTGRKYNDDKHNLDRLRDLNDELARSHGIKRELDRIRDSHRPSDRFLRQAQRGGGYYSWKLDLQDRIRGAGRRSFSEEEFRKRLTERGVELRIRAEKYSFSMTDAHGKARVIREGRLGLEYHRSSLTERFSQQKMQLREDPEGYRRRLKEEALERYSWQRDLRSRISESLRGAQSPRDLAHALAERGVSMSLGGPSKFTFTFQDRHGLTHGAISPARLYAGRPDRIVERLEENSRHATPRDSLQTPSTSLTALRETSGLVSSLMREVESASRQPHGVRDRDQRPSREDSRLDPRRRRGFAEPEGAG